MLEWVSLWRARLEKSCGAHGWAVSRRAPAASRMTHGTHIALEGAARVVADGELLAGVDVAVALQGRGVGGGVGAARLVAAVRLHTCASQLGVSGNQPFQPTAGGVGSPEWVRWWRARLFLRAEL